MFDILQFIWHYAHVVEQCWPCRLRLLKQAETVPYYIYMLYSQQVQTKKKNTKDRDRDRRREREREREMSNIA